MNESTHKKVSYLPHRLVIRDSTKVTIVYDNPAKTNKDAASLNDFLETGSPLQNSLWNILIRTTFRLILLCGDINKAFLQIRIRELKKMP